MSQLYNTVFPNIVQQENYSNKILQLLKDGGNKALVTAFSTDLQLLVTLGEKRMGKVKLRYRRRRRRRKKRLRMRREMRVNRELEVEKVVGLERDLRFDQEADMLSSDGTPI